MAKLPTDAEMMSVQRLLVPYFRQFADPADVERAYFYAIRAKWANVGMVEYVRTYDYPQDIFGRKRMAVDVRLKAKSITVVAETPEGKTVMVHSDDVTNVNMRHIALAPSPSYRFGSEEQHRYDTYGGEYRVDAIFNSYTMTETIGGTYQESGPHGIFLPRSTFIIPKGLRGFSNVELE
jgi:hypothetical protein